MAQHNESGKYGEEVAEKYLLQHNYSILHRNWRYSYHEIDIIALKNNVLHFVEVKLRSSKNFGMPEVHVNKKKFKFLAQAADQFLFLNQQYKHIQFDILSINILNGQNEIFFIQDVYL
ncbi:MAG TPA: YraN family protein [Flavisolibacter sp.]|nr:YraN family protein [Flavisolibacter sp.]